MKYLLLIVLLVAVVITAGCISGNQNTPVTPTSQTVQKISDEPIVGNWQWTTNDVTKIYKFYFYPDGRYSYTDPINNITISGTWDTIRENMYNVTYSDGKTQTFVYNRTTDTFTIPEFSQVLAYRLGKEPVATIPTTVETIVPTVTTTLSKEPIVGTWEYKLESGKIFGTWTFKPDGTFFANIVDVSIPLAGVWRKVSENRYEAKFNSDKDYDENQYIYIPQTDTVNHDIIGTTRIFHRIYTTPTTQKTVIPTQTLTQLSSSGSTHLSGNGDDVQSFTATGSGLRIFTMSHIGSHNFAVVLKDSGGNYLTLLANEIGSYSGKKSERLTSGTYYLDITADGSWTIDISSM